MECQELSFTAGRNTKWHSLFGAQFDKLYTKLNMLLPYDQAIALFGIYPKELKTYNHRKKKETCTWMFIAAAFITAVREEIHCGIPKQWDII